MLLPSKFQIGTKIGCQCMSQCAGMQQPQGSKSGNLGLLGPDGVGSDSRSFGV